MFLMRAKVKNKILKPLETFPSNFVDLRAFVTNRFQKALLQRNSFIIKQLRSLRAAHNQISDK
jgi:hypothetical protein